jgi:hypothetical protein
MFDTRIFYLQMTDTRNRPQVVSTEKRRQPRIPGPRATSRNAGR